MSVVARTASGRRLKAIDDRSAGLCARRYFLGSLRTSEITILYDPVILHGTAFYSVLRVMSPVCPFPPSLDYAHVTHICMTREAFQF